MKVISNLKIFVIKKPYWVRWFTLFLLVSGCSRSTSPKKVHHLTVRFEQQRILGRGSQSEYFFMAPRYLQMVRTDGYGNIYVLNSQKQDFEVFNRNGHYIRSIGKKGRGPGELNGVRTFEINHENDLIVFDGGNRRVTCFSDSGKVLWTRIPPNRTMAWPDVSHIFGNGNYLMLRKLRTILNSQRNHNASLYSDVFHLYNRKFQYLSSFGNVDSLINKAKNGFVQIFTRMMNPGRFCVVNDKEVFFAPGIYDGHIFKFKDTQKGWKHVGTIIGHIMVKNPVSIFSEPKKNAKGELVVITYGKNKITHYAGQIRSEELGLFKLNNGRLLNITRQIIKGSYETMVEVFNSKDKLQGVGQLKKIKVLGVEHFFQSYFWKDKKDRFYFIDRQDTTPFIRIGKIKIMNEK